MFFETEKIKKNYYQSLIYLIYLDSESTTGSSALSVLTQTGTKLLKKANNGHMPCGPL